MPLKNGAKTKLESSFIFIIVMKNLPSIENKIFWTDFGKDEDLLIVTKIFYFQIDL